MRILSDPLKLGIPADRICEQKLNKADSQICEIRLGKMWFNKCNEIASISIINHNFSRHNINSNRTSTKPGRRSLEETKGWRSQTNSLWMGRIMWWLHREKRIHPPDRRPQTNTLHTTQRWIVEAIVIVFINFFMEYLRVEEKINSRVFVLSVKT